MSVIYVLIPLAVIIVAIAIAVFFWAVKSNQFDDLERQGYSILFDDDIQQKEKNNNSQQEIEPPLKQHRVDNDHKDEP